MAFFLLPGETAADFIARTEELINEPPANNEPEKHNANHRIERSTSGISARCLDCDWAYEYD